MRALAILLVLIAAPAAAQGDAPAGGTLYCENLDQIDAQREAENRGFDRLYASISTMTTAAFCGYPDLSDKIDERIRRQIWAYDDRAASLTPEETTQLRQVKASYVLGRSMIDRRN